MRLVYEIGADASQLKRVLRGVEGEARASNRRVGQDRAAAMFGPSRRDAAQARRFEEQQARQLNRARESLDRQRSRSLLANIRTEERERIASEKRVARAAEREARAVARESQRAAAARAATVSNIRRGAATSVIGGMGLIGRAGGAALALAGGFGAAGALSEQHSIQRQASQLAISAGTPGEKKALEREALGVRGFTGSETLGAMQGFVTKTGDLAAARGLVGDLGELALATSADFGELGEAAGQAFNVIRDTISDPKKQLEAVNDVMRTLAAQGNLGAVEIKDLTTELGGLGAATRKFGGDPVELLKTVGAMAQAAIARGGAGTAPETTTAVSRFAADIVQNQSRFEANGVDVFTDKSRTKLRGPEDIVLDVLSKTGGDLTKISDMFGVYAERALAGFSPLFVDAEKREKGTGRAAVKSEFKRFRDAGITDQQLKERAALRMADDDLQLKEATKSFNAAVGEQLSPVAAETAKKFTGLVPQIAGMTRVVAKFAGFLLENPFQGAGVIVGAKIAKDIGAAGIGNLISGEIKGKLGAAFSGLGLGLSVATMIVTAGILSFEKGEADIKAGGQDLNRAREAAKNGDVAALEEIINRQEGRVDKAKDPGVLAAIFEGIQDFVSFKPYYAMEPGETKKDVAQRAADSIAEPNRDVNVRSHERFLEDMESLRGAAQRAAEELKKIKPNQPEASRTAPMNSPSRG